jgi:hypothetical protein
MSQKLHFTLRAGLFTAITAAIAATTFTGSFANPVCGDRTMLIRTLSDRYHEAPKSMGLSADGAVVEILASTAGSWTILITRPDGLACLMASGESWENLPQMAEGPKV